MPTEATDLSSSIATSASGPKSAAGDSFRTEQHSLPDQIAADKYLAAKAAMNSPGAGIRMVRIEPPGIVDIDCDRDRRW